MINMRSWVCLLLHYHCKIFQKQVYEPCNQVIDAGSTWTYLCFWVYHPGLVSPFENYLIVCQIVLCHLTRIKFNVQLISVKLDVVHFFIFWDTKTRNKTHSEAHHWHPYDRLRQASCLGGAEITASVSGVLMWGSWIIHKHVWCCQLRKPEKWLENVLPIIRDTSLCLNMLQPKCFLLSETPFPMAESGPRWLAKCEECQCWTFLSTSLFHSTHSPYISNERVSENVPR